jgi:hypothetical protein
MITTLPALPFQFCTCRRNRYFSRFVYIRSKWIGMPIARAYYGLRQQMVWHVYRNIMWSPGAKGQYLYDNIIVTWIRKTNMCLAKNGFMDQEDQCGCGSCHCSCLGFPPPTKTKYFAETKWRKRGLFR